MPRILTYNVRHCLGIDGRLSFQRIATVIASCEPDIVALQELDAHRARSGGIDQARAIADELRMEAHFFAAIQEETGAYGDAILTAYPCTLAKAGLLPTLKSRPFVEPRGALWVSVHVGGAEIQVFNTHLGLLEALRLQQLGGLLGPDWIGHPDCREPVILAGDFNAIPGSCAYKRLAACLRDAQTGLGKPRPQPTYPSRAPLLRLDHVFVSRSIEVLKAQVVRTPPARIASDHLPLQVDFRVVACRERALQSRDSSRAGHR